MKHLSKAEDAAACRIFREVNRISNNYYGTKTDQEIHEYCSLNRWIMFPNKGIGSLAEGRSAPLPNVYISFGEDQEIKDNGEGKAEGYIGMTFNNGDAMRGLLESIFKRPQKRTAFIGWLNNLSSDWYAEISQKIKIHCLNFPPRWKIFDTFDDLSTITHTDIIHRVIDSNNNILQKGDDDDGVMVQGSVTTFNVSKDLTLQDFDTDVKESLTLLQDTLDLF